MSCAVDMEPNIGLAKWLVAGLMGGYNDPGNQ